MSKTDIKQMWRMEEGALMTATKHLSVSIASQDVGSGIILTKSPEQPADAKWVIKLWGLLSLELYNIWEF